jgi:hypothetical protein
MASAQQPDDKSQQQAIQELTQQVAALVQQVSLFQRVNACLCQENQDLQQGRDTLLERIKILEMTLQRDRQNLSLEAEPNEERFALGDRWLLKTAQIDYTHLRDLLAQQDWDAADEETQQIMLQLAGPEAEQQGFLSAEHLSDFPCLDLKILNKLWTIYSNGKYGFMVQREIWSRTHSTRNLWHSPEMDGYYPRREGLGYSLAQRLQRCALDDF